MRCEKLHVVQSTSTEYLAKNGSHSRRVWLYVGELLIRADRSVMTVMLLRFCTQLACMQCRQESFVSPPINLLDNSAAACLIDGEILSYTRKVYRYIVGPLSKKYYRTFQNIEQLPLFLSLTLVLLHHAFFSLAASCPSIYN